jgi:hypothetical protein
VTLPKTGLVTPCTFNPLRVKALEETTSLVSQSLVENPILVNGV